MLKFIENDHVKLLTTYRTGPLIVPQGAAGIIKPLPRDIYRQMELKGYVCVDFMTYASWVVKIDDIEMVSPSQHNKKRRIAWEKQQAKLSSAMKHGQPNDAENATKDGQKKQ